MKLSETDRKLQDSRIRSAKSKAEERDALTGPDRESGFRTTPDRNKALLRGTYWPQRNRHDVLVINQITPNLAVKHSLISGGQTEFLVRSRDEKFEAAVEIAQGLLNDHWAALHFDKETGAAEWDTGAFRFGVVELYWKYEDEFIEIEGGRPDTTTEAEQNIAEDTLPMMAGGQMMAPAPMDGMADEEQGLNLPGVEYPDEEAAYEAADSPYDTLWNKPKHDDPMIERFSPSDFFVDPHCTKIDLSDARYVIRRKKLPLDQVKANKRFRNTSKLKADEVEYHAGEGSADDELSETISSKYGLITIYDMWLLADKDKDGKDEVYHAVFTESGKLELLFERCPYDFGKHAPSPWPFECTPANVVDFDDEWQALPDVNTVAPLQIAYDLANTQFEWKRSHTPDILVVPTGTFDGEDGPERKRRMEQGLENAILEADPDQIAGIRWIDHPAMHPDLYSTIAEVPQRIRGMLGISEYQFNSMPDKQLTLGEAQIAAGQGSSRQQAEIEQYDDFLSRIAYKLIAMFQQLGVRSRAYSYPGADGTKAWGMATQHDLRGTIAGTQSQESPFGDLEDIGIQFAFEVSPGKRQKANRYGRRKELLELLELSMKFAQTPDPRLPTRSLIDITALLQSVVETYELPGKYKIIPPAPTEQETQAYQQQIADQQAQAQAQQEQAKADQEAQAAAAQGQQQADQEKSQIDTLLKVAQITGKSGGNLAQ